MPDQPDPARHDLGVAPASPAQLRYWLIHSLGIQPPPPHNQSQGPLDYLCHTFFETGRATGPDCLVWACRGGGKTFYAAVATVLDMVFKPGIEVRLLGGSREQSERMHEHLRRLFEAPALRAMVASRPTARAIRLVNGSRTEILAQSPTSVRGVRVQKLRCDEVELFDPEIWQAAQLVTRSRRCGTVMVHGAVEALSTAHRPGGLMSRLIDEAAAAMAHANGRRLFRWNVIDVLERCDHAAHDCAGCPLADDCRATARHNAGHITVADALAQRARSDHASWESEMLCLRPRRSDAVFPEFDPDIHVADGDPPPMDAGARWVCGMDFGFRAPTVVLWGVVTDDASGAALHILDEHVASGVVLDAHIQTILGGRWPRPAWIGVDPAGAQRSEQTGASAITVLKRAGLSVRHPRIGVEEGLRLIRARLAPASGPVRLFVHRRCKSLIHAMQTYHFPAHQPQSPKPVKDGPDHAVDALRYLVNSLERHGPVHVGRYTP